MVSWVSVEILRNVSLSGEMNDLAAPDREDDGRSPAQRVFDGWLVWRRTGWNRLLVFILAALMVSPML